jgi:hypothetical protein
MIALPPHECVCGELAVRYHLLARGAGPERSFKAEAVDINKAG